MSVRINEEIKLFDEDLKLFDENSWDFLNVDHTQENYEYFNDIRDTDFDLTNRQSVLKNSLFLPLVAIVGTTALIILFFVVKTNLFDYSDYRDVQNIASVADKNVAIQHVEGTKVSEDDETVINEKLTNYFNTLKEGEGYRHLYAYCLDTSNFADTYDNYVTSMETNFDVNDCYARALRLFGQYYNYNGITEVVYKNGIYYCYADVYLVTDTDAEEYVYSCSYNINKYFSVNEINTANMVRFLVDQSDTQPINRTRTEICIKFAEKDGDLYILDDSNITSQCISAYTSATMQMTYTVRGISN